MLEVSGKETQDPLIGDVIRCSPLPSASHKCDPLFSLSQLAASFNLDRVLPQERGNLYDLSDAIVTCTEKKNIDVLELQDKATPL